MKAIDLVKTYTILKDAKVSKLEFKDKSSLIKDMSILRPIFEKMEADEKEAAEKMKGEEHEQILKLVEKDKVSKTDKTAPKLTEKEIVKVNNYFNEYYKSLNTYLEELHNKEEEVELTLISEEGFDKLTSNNDFTCEQLIILYDTLCTKGN